MAQLRDAQTSELITEGTPTEMVLLAEKLGREKFIFDGVGLRFDPDAVLAAHNENLAYFSDAAKTASGEEKEYVENALKGYQDTIAAVDTMATEIAK